VHDVLGRRGGCGTDSACARLVPNQVLHCQLCTLAGLAHERLQPLHPFPATFSLAYLTWCCPASLPTVRSLC
jgi:hypothetical protein